MLKVDESFGSDAIVAEAGISSPADLRGKQVAFAQGIPSHFFLACVLEDAGVAHIEGRARVVDAATNAKLEVSFFWPFRGDYWIIDLGKDYEYAVVGHPSRDYLWILSRTPTMDGGVYARILQRLRAKGYQVDRLQKTLQPSSATTAPPAAG